MLVSLCTIICHQLLVASHPVSLLNFLENHTVIDTWTVHDLNAHYTWLTGKNLLLLGVRNEKMISKLTINRRLNFFSLFYAGVKQLVEGSSTCNYAGDNKIIYYKPFFFYSTCANDRKLCFPNPK